jgi:hypothetical protein
MVARYEVPGKRRRMVRPVRVRSDLAVVIGYCDLRACHHALLSL